AARRDRQVAPVSGSTKAEGAIAMDALDRELARALAVDPSPEFLARVRARVADEPAPSPWRMPRLLLAAGAVAVLILAVAVVTPRSREAEAVQAVRPAVPEIPRVASGLS